MSLDAIPRRKPVILIAGIVAALFCSAGIATIMDWGVSERTSAEYAGMLAFLKRGDINRSVMARQDTHDTVALARATARCAGCAVIESIVVAEMRDETTGVCAADDWVDYGSGLNKLVVAGGRNLAPLAEIVAEAVVRNIDAGNMQSAAGYGSRSASAMGRETRSGLRAGRGGSRVSESGSSTSKLERPPEE